MDVMWVGTGILQHCPLPDSAHRGSRETWTVGRERGRKKAMLKVQIIWAAWLLHHILAKHLPEELEARRDVGSDLLHSRALLSDSSSCQARAQKAH